MKEINMKNGKYDRLYSIQVKGSGFTPNIYDMRPTFPRRVITAASLEQFQWSNRAGD
jgi:hypothetical protein